MGGEVGCYDWLTFLTVKESNISGTFFSLNIIRTIIGKSPYTPGSRIPLDPYKLHMTPDMWHIEGGEHSLKFQLSSSQGLGFMMF